MDCLGFFRLKNVRFNLGRTREGEGLDATPHEVFLSFFLEDKTSPPDVFSSCSFIPRADFETSLVMVRCYGYEFTISGGFNLI